MQPPLLPAEDAVELRTQFDVLVVQLEDWEKACEMLSDALVRDLGYLGVDVGSLRGFYSDSLTESPMTGVLLRFPAHDTGRVRWARER